MNEQSKQIVLNIIAALLRHEEDTVMQLIKDAKLTLNDEDFALASTILNQFPDKYDDYIDVVFQCLTTIGMLKFTTNIIISAANAGDSNLASEALSKMLLMPTIDHTDVDKFELSPEQDERMKYVNKVLSVSNKTKDAYLSRLRRKRGTGKKRKYE